MNQQNDTQSTHRAQIKLCEKSTSCELSNDYVLPDYLPEIRRVLRVSASILPATKYIGGSRAEFCGSLDYRVLYVAQDGKLYSAPLAAEYSLSVPLEIPSSIDLGEGIILLCDAIPEGALARVSAPRKLTVKCKISGIARAYGSAVLDELISGKSVEDGTERLIGSCRSEYVTAGVGDTVELSAEINIASDSIRVIDSAADLIINEVTAFEGIAECKGEAIIKLLICDESSEDEPKLIEQKIPFEDKSEIEGLTTDAECVARGYIGNVNVSVSESSILCTLNAYTEITAHTEQSFLYTKDLYSTTNHTECAYKTYTVISPLSCQATNFTQSERIELDEGTSAAGASVIGCLCEPKVSSVAYEAGREVVLGQCRYLITAKKDGEYFCYEESVPFRYEFAAREAHTAAHVQVIPATSTARIDGKTLSLDSELRVLAELSGECEIETLCEACFGAAIEKKSSDMIICYPSPDDTLWSVSKRYSVPPIKVDGISDPDQKLDGVDYVIVNF